MQMFTRGYFWHSFGLALLFGRLMWFPDARRNIRLLLFIGWFAPVCWTPPLPPPSLFYRIIFINGTYCLLLCRCLLFRSPVLGLVFFRDHWSSRLKRTSPFCNQIYDIYIYIYIMYYLCWWQSGGAGGVRSEYTRGLGKAMYIGE